MSELQIDEIVLESPEHLLVRPGNGKSYPMIYRAANGLRWNDEQAAIVAYEPKRWPHDKLLAHIISTIESECGEKLVVGESTKWVNISDELRHAMLYQLAPSDTSRKPNL
jgi:hypothetical protein